MTQLGTKKSRKGCTNCKRRRVKAGGIDRIIATKKRPVPTAQDETGLRFDHHNARLGLPSTYEEWLQDLELMDHYNRDPLLQPLGIGNDMHHMRRESIPREATRHPFLMHGILALSALHIAHERPMEAKKYVPLCDRHQSKALEMFRTVLSGTITPDISTALFALSSTLSVLSIARSCADALAMPEPRFIGMEQVAELFALTRGVRDIIHTCTHWMPTGLLEPILDVSHVPQGGSPLPAQVERQFFSLHEMLLHSCSPEALPGCLQALRHLKDVYRRVCRSSRSSSVCSEQSGSGFDMETSHIWRWILLVPNEFVRMIAAGFAPALIILAHFAAVSTTIRRAWYTNDWGHHVLTGISMCLNGTDMYAYLDWPLEQARHGMMILSHPTEIDSVINGNSPCTGFVDMSGWNTPLNLDDAVHETDFDFMNF